MAPKASKPENSLPGLHNSTAPFQESAMLVQSKFDKTGVKIQYYLLLYLSFRNWTQKMAKKHCIGLLSGTNSHTWGGLYGLTHPVPSLGPYICTCMSSSDRPILKHRHRFSSIFGTRLPYMTNFNFNWKKGIVSGFIFPWGYQMPT